MMQTIDAINECRCEKADKLTSTLITYLKHPQIQLTLFIEIYH